MAMNILIRVIGKVAEYTVEPVGRELGYLCFLDGNFQELKNQVEKLKETKESVEDKVNTARRNAERIKSVVEKWSNKVADIVAKSEAILANESGHGGLCSTNRIQRYKLSRQAKKLADEALEMKNEGDNFDTVSLKGSVSLAESSLPKVVDFLNFESRKLTMEQIMDALSADNVHRIGVYGMGGVGKTMLVHKILRKIVESKSFFDEVVKSTVSQTPDVKNIQGQLADMLGFEFKRETIEGRAVMLKRRLKVTKSILVFLDDVWDSIDFERIGIPSVEDHTGCKILFTSRDTHLFSNEINVDKIFEIKVLEEDESWNLFEATMAGKIIDEACDLEPTAIEIVRKCAGLPIAITTVATALRNKPSAIWKDALDQLRSDDVVMPNIRGMDKTVYLPLKLSYDFLKRENAKLLFLLCSMFPEDFDIDVEKLQEYAMAMGFFRGVQTVAQGRRRITTLVDHLISSSLLLQSQSMFGYDHVKMHDLVRDVAISIASGNDHIRTLCYVKRSNEELEEEKLSGNHTAVFLSIQNYHHRLDRPRLDLPKLILPKVQLFVLVARSVSLVETFFEEMKELKGLVLEAVNISSSLPSLYSLTNIRLLRLRCCELRNIDMIGELKKLEILDLSETAISEIPTTMSQFTQLKVLNLSGCHQLKVIPPNILSKLTKLEELYLETFTRWEGEEWYEGRKNASLSELGYLPHLRALNLTIPDDQEIMPKHSFLRELNLEKFDIVIGRVIRIILNQKRILRLVMESRSCLDDWIKMLLKRSEVVILKGSICSKALHLELLDANDFLHLKHLVLYNNLELQHLIHEKNKPLRKFVSKLEDLNLGDLKNLESIIDGYAGESTFNELRNVFVSNCNKLETLFYNCTLDDVLNLRKIDISNCEKLEVMIIVMENEEATNHIEFTHLEALSLTSVARLQKFCSKIETRGQLISRDNSENLETNTISNDIGGSFFSEQVSLPSLEQLTINRADNLKMIWSNVLILNSFSKLKEVEIYSCNNLQKVFSPNMISILTCLNTLKIKDCELLEGIFEVQEPSITETSPIVFQTLTYLELRNLPNLEYVWSKNHRELLAFENMETLFIIENCSRLKREYSVKILKQLETLEIDIRQLMEVVGKEKSADNMLESKQLENSKVEVKQLRDHYFELFPRLRYLKLYGFLDYNSTHLPMEILQIMLYDVEEFELEGAFIEEVFPMEMVIPMEDAESIRLQRLVLSKLPKLRHLWSECSPKNTPILDELFYLRISECGALSSLVSFTNLTFLSRLEVEKCDRLTHLLNPSAARMLVNLEEMKLKGCKRMSTVIEGGADEEGNDEIVFNNLYFLNVDSLSRLTGFYSGRCIIKFPHLVNVDIRNCPEMKVFSLGTVSTPDLKPNDVRLNGTCYLPKDSKEMIVEDMNVIIRETWEDNMDTSIPYLFGEQKMEEIQLQASSSSNTS